MNSLLQKNLISTKEASALSGYNADYLSRLCREKKITSSQVGRTWLIERASLEVFMETQVDRKIELAENLARERELEYRKANSSVAQVSEIANDLENRMRVAASSMLGAFTTVRIPRSMPIMSGQAFAAGLTAVILGASVTLAGSGVVARAGEMLLTSAFEARALTVAAISSSDSVARTKTAEFSKIAEDEIKKIDTTLIRAVDARVATLPVTLSEVIENSHEPVVMSELAYARAGEIFETYPKPLTATQIVASLLDTGAHPEEMFAAITREALLAYNRLGAYALNDIETVLALHMQGVEVAANGLLSASATTRDIAGRAPLAIGNVFLTASSATLSSYERAIYAYVENIDVVPSTIASTVYGLGNGIGGSVVVGMLSAPVIYEEGVVAFVEESVSAGSFISEGSFAFGKEADRTISGLLEAEDRAIVQSVEGARLALTSVRNGAASAVLAVESVPSFTTDKILGVMGGVALRIERADASVLSASPLVSLDIDRFIPGFLQNVTAVVAHAVGSAFHGVFGPLAGFFGASEEVGLAVIPNDGSSFSGPDGEVTTEEALRGNTTVYNGPVTIVRNEYPTVNYSGVSQAYVDERLALLRRTLYTRVVDRTSDTIYGEIRDADIIDSRVAGSTFANGAITDSTITGGTITGSSLNVASTTITGSLTVNGDIAANGITATSSVITNATSTSLFATNATLTNATSTTFYATLATIVDGFFTNLTATLATITNAVIANLTATNATLTNATSTNATSTNLFATNFIATNATSTNLFATGARFTTGIIDALTSPLANITTAVITNLTATNSTLTNATSTNSFALSYLTPSRLLSVGSNGVATSTSLSSWVAGTLNQLTVTDNGTGGITLSLPSTIAIGTSQVTTIRSDGATSTFGGGIQASIVEGGQYIAGPYVLATSTTATSAFSGNIAVGRNATFGTSASDLLTVNSAVASNLIPSANNTYDLGSTGSYWRRGYVDELTVNNLSAASTSIAGTVSSSFTINTDNATNDTEDATLIFKRGIASPNALMTWNSTTDRFEFNMPVFSADGIFTNATSTTSFTSALKANTFAAGQSASTTISSTGALSTPSLTATNLSITRVPFITTAGLFTDSAAFTFDSSLAKLSVTNASTTNISNSSLTSGRVTYAGTGGLLQDSSNLLFNGTTLTSNALSVTNGTTLSGALTYGGVTLSNSVTGTGSMVLSASPTFTGTSVFADLTATNATSTTFFTSTLGLGSGNYFTSLLGNGLTNVGGTLTVSTSSLSSGFFLQGGNSFGTTAILGTNDAQNLAFETGGSTRITVDTSGNVGIGTTTPSSLLNLYKSTDGYAKMTIRNPNTGTDALAGLDFVQDLGGAGSLYATGNTFDGNADFGALSGFSNSLWLDASFELTGGLKLVARNGDIGFYAGSRSTQNVTISGTNGNLGVGSTTPYARLSVKGAGTTTGVNFQTTNSSNSPLFTVLDSGSVGIGTTSPEAKLTVAGALSASGLITSYATGESFRAGNGGTSPLSLRLLNTGNDVYFGTEGSTAGGFFTGSLAYSTVVYSNTAIQNIIGGVSRMIVDTSGNVGIGTTIPLSKQHLAGSAQTATAGASDILTLERPFNSGVSFARFGTIALGSADATSNGAGRMDFRISPTASGISANPSVMPTLTTVLTLLGDGNVGIGTTSPAATLAVQGSGLFSGDLSVANLTATSSISALFFNASQYGGFQQNSSLLGYASSTNTATLWGLGAGGNNATTSATSRGTVAVGYQAFNALTTGANNTAVGYRAGYKTNDQGQNSFFGYEAGAYATTSSQNVAIGYRALKGNTSTFSATLPNVAIGYTALTANTSGGYNTAIGTNALAANTTGSQSVAIGTFALQSSLSGGNNAIGYNAMGTCTTCANNNALGNSVLASLTTGQDNVAFGNSSQFRGTTAGANATFGYASLYTNKTGTDNIAFGNDSLRYIDNATSTVAIGSGAGASSSGGTYQNNVFLGYRAGFVTTTGANNNILLGYQAGNALTTGANNIVIGYDIDAPSATGSNQLTIGNLIYGTGINGDGTTVSTGNIGIGTAVPGSKLQVSTSNSEYLPSTSAFSIRKNEEGYGLFAGVSGSGNSWLQAGTSNDATNYDLILQSRGGNVGIGNTSPAAKLHVVGGGVVVNTTGGAGTSIGRHINLGSVTTPTDWRSYTGNTTAAIQMENSATEGFVLAATQGAVVPRTQFITTGGFEIQVGATIGGAGTNAFQILSSGNVGIGTTTPLSKLQVTTSGADAFSLDLLTGSSHDTGLRIGRGSGANGAGIQMVTAATDYLSFYVNGSALPAINTAAQMVLTEGGNVGIGTTTPQAKLSVIGSGALGGITISNASTGVGTPRTLELNNSAMSSPVSGHLLYGTDGTGWQFRIGKNQAGVITDQFIVQDNGAVGIGDTSPDAKLDILQASDAAAQGLQISRSNDSDFMRLYMSAGVGALSDTLIFSSAFAGDVAAIGREGSGYFAGNMAIGTSTPVSKLSVYQASGAGRTIAEFSNGNRDRMLQVVHDISGDSTSYIGLNAREYGSTLGRDFVLQTGGTERMRVIFSTGNIAIGATAVVGDERLNVNGRIRAGTFQDYNLTGATFYGAEPTGTAASIQLHQAGIASVRLGSKASDSNLYLTNDYGGSGLGTAATSLTISSTGNVGIGTTGPGAKLHVTATTAITDSAGTGAALKLTDSGAISLFADGDEISTSASTLYLGNTGGSNKNVSIGASFYAASGGNVGIGSTTPAYKLSLYGTDDNSANTSNTGSQFAVEGDGHGIYMRMKGIGSAGISGSTYANQIFSRGGNIGLEVFSDAQLVLGSSNTERMRITAAGNVGIGTTTPQGKLAVSGGTAIFDNPGGAIRVLKTTGSFNSGDLGIWNRAGSGGNVFAIADWATGNNGVFIDTSTGNVGIGETAPSERLVVAGQGTGRMLVGDVGFGDGYTGLSMNGVLSTTNYNLLGSPGQAHLWINRATGGNIHFNENNVQQVTILSGGNVGIGESVPGYKLTVSGTNTYSTQTGQVHIADTASSMRLNIGVGVDSSANKVSWIQSTETGVSNDRNLALQPYAGKVGIGTTTPDAHLSVNATVGGGDGTAIKITNLNAGLTASPEYMSLLFNGYVGEPRVKIQATEERGNTYASQLLFSLNTGSGPNTMQERMRIVGASGNVGIGTTTPSARLTVSDSGNNIHALQIDKTIGGSDALRLTTNFSGGNAVALNPYISGVSNGGFEITLAGTQRMVIENGGDVGIGTTNPAGSLDIRNANSVTTGLQVGGGTVGNYLTIHGNSSAGGLSSIYTNYFSSEGDLVLGTWTNRSNQLYLKSTGNVGIGTTNPTGKLDIMGAYTDVSLVSDSVAIANFRTPGHVQMAINTQVGSPYTTSLQAKHTSIDGNAYPIALNPLGGNVGIGTTGPNYKLDVNGSMQVNGIWQFHSNGQFNWGSGYGSGTLTWDTGYAKIHAQGTNALKLYSANAGTGIDVVSTGFVGIGKTDPQYKLDVQAGTGNMMVRSTSDAPLLISSTDTWAGIGFYDANASDFLWYYGGGDSFAIGGGGSLVNKLSVYGNMTVGEGYNNTAAPANGMMIEGDLRVGTTTVGAFTSALDIAYTGGGTEYGIEMRPANDSTVAIAFQNAAGSAVGSISTGLSTTAYNTSSDRRLKENIVLSTRGIETLRQIGVQEYNFKNDPGNRTQGYIAQDLYEVYPEAVRVGTDISNPWSVDYGRITPLIVKSIQDLDMRTLSLAPAAENTEAHSLAVSSDASIAGMLTVTGTGTFSDSLTAASILTEGSVTALSFLTETNETLPNEVLTGGSADLFKMASYAITSLQVLSERADLLATRLDDIDARVAALESGSTADEISGVVGLTVATIKSALQTLGIYLENGVAQFETLVFRQLAVAKDTNGDSSVGSETILAGNTVVEVENPYVLPTSKIFVTFTGPIQGAWYISNKEEGKFRVTLADGQSADVSFDYFILQTEGQLASPGAAAPAQTPNDSAPSSDPLPPVFPGEGTGTTTPVMGSGDTTPPSITLNGSAAREIDQGATWIDEGATASDETDGDLTSSIQVQGTVDTGTPGTYTVSYSVSDAAGNEAHVSRIVSVQVVSPPTAPEQPAPAPEPTPSPAPEPAP